MQLTVLHEWPISRGLYEQLRNSWLIRELFSIHLCVVDVWLALDRRPFLKLGHVRPPCFFFPRIHHSMSPLADSRHLDCANTCVGCRPKPCHHWFGFDTVETLRRNPAYPIAISQRCRLLREIKTTSVRREGKRRPDLHVTCIWSLTNPMKEQVVGC
jgi:hypothetical protein